MASSTDQPQAAHSNMAPASPSPLLALPSETLRAILSYAEPSDLVSLCRVSKAVRDVAVTLLYRSLSHEFTELKSGDPAVDRLAGVLETLVTSDFNYASFIKEINLGATYVADATMTQEFHYGSSCGKFFNTLLISTLKKVLALENFRWDIRVEMSPSVFAILGKITSLRHLHLRMHAGQSLSSSTLQVVPTLNPPPVSTSHHHHHSPPPVAPAAGFHFGTPGASGGGRVSLIERHEVHKFTDSQRTFSRFQHLESLAVLEMDTLEYVPEIAQCISLCSGGLKNLKLSFSEGLALKARNKPTQTTSDTDSTVPDEEDEWYEPDDFVSPAAADASAGASNDPDTRRERMEQERVLSTIFGCLKETKTDNNPDFLERFVADAIVSANKKSLASTKWEVGISADHSFVKELRSVSRELREKHVSHGKNRNKTLKAIEKLHAAANLYLERCAFTECDTVANENAIEAAPATGLKTDSALLNDHMGAGPSTIPTQGGPWQSTSPGDEKVEGGLLSPNHADFDSGDASQKDDILDIVDMEHPDDDGDEGEDQEFLDPEDLPTETGVGESIVGPGTDSLDKSSERDTRKGASNKGKEPVRQPNNTPDLTEAGRQDGKCNGNNHASDRKIQEYVRSRHGLPLEYLSIYLIPVKPSVVCRAVNIWALRHISLLNVGAQRPFWATLGKLHESNPLQISSIHTDNVSTTFLDFVGDLGCVKELFMFERSSRSAVKSLAPKTTVSIEEITKKVLKKHIRHLERLLIRNDEDTSWSLNMESARMITRRGSNLKELVVALKSANFHKMIRDIANLKSLVVFHILFSSDLCPGVLREIRSCVLNYVLPLSSLKIRYIAVSYALKEPQSTTISQIHRESLPASQSRRFSDSNTSDSSSVVAIQGKASEQDKAKQDPNVTSSVVLSQDEDDLDSLYVDHVTVFEDLKIEDIKDVRVWEKEIWHLRL